MHFSVFVVLLFSSNSRCVSPCFSLYILFIVDWETSFANYMNPFPLCGCECYLVAALACSFSKSTRVSLTIKRYGSLLTRASHLPSPFDGLSPFPQDHTCKWCQRRSENSVPEIFIPDRESNKELLC